MPPKATSTARSALLSALADALAAYSEEFDPSEPELMQVRLDRHLSSFLKSTGLKLSKGHRNADLDDILAELLGKEYDSALQWDAQLLLELIGGYRDAGFDDDIQQAESLVGELIVAIRKLAIENSRA
jgi:hypothetical protein